MVSALYPPESVLHYREGLFFCLWSENKQLPTSPWDRLISKYVVRTILWITDTNTILHQIQVLRFTHRLSSRRHRILDLSLLLLQVRSKQSLERSFLTLLRACAHRHLQCCHLEQIWPKARDLYTILLYILCYTIFILEHIYVNKTTDLFYKLRKLTHLFPSKRYHSSDSVASI